MLQVQGSMKSAVRFHALIFLPIIVLTSIAASGTVLKPNPRQSRAPGFAIFQLTSRLVEYFYQMPANVT
jgi:hypothetical protein